MQTLRLARCAAGLACMPLLGFVLTAGCSPRSASDGSAAKTSSQTKGSPSVGNSAVRIEKAELEPQELTKLGRLQAWTYKYTGGPVRCWMEIEEAGQQTMTYGKSLDKDAQSKHAREINHEEGKIVLVIRETGIDDMFEVALWYFGEREESCRPVWFLAKPLWFGWDSHTVLDQAPLSGQPATPEKGKELTLYVWDRREVKTAAGPDASPPREVILRLKAVFDEKK